VQDAGDVAAVGIELVDELGRVVRIAQLRGQGTGLSRDRLFALAELSFIYAQQENRQDHYLAAAVYAYAFLLQRDEYPPFSGEPGQYPLTLEVEYREDLSRWLIFVKWLLAIPHYIVLAFLGLAASVAVLIAFFAILFTGRYPRGLFDFVVGTARWWVRVNAYAHWLMTDRYPPFSLK